MPTHDDVIETKEVYMEIFFERYKGKLVLAFLKSVSIYSSLNGKLSLNRLKKNQRSYKNLPNSAFLEDFPKNVSLKILNSGIMLKTFTHHVFMNID